MSRMTQRRLKRRTGRKLCQQRRELRRSEQRRVWLAENLSAAFRALDAMRKRNRALGGDGAPDIDPKTIDAAPAAT